MFKLGEIILDKYKVTGYPIEGGDGFIIPCRKNGKRLIAKIGKIPGDESIKNEIMILKQLNGTNRIARLEDSSEEIAIIEDGGIDLDDWMSTRRTKKTRLRTALQIVEGLTYLQSKGIIHRDLKPTNIVVRNGCAKITDFSSATVNGSYENDFVVGKYTPPENLYGNISGLKGDIYSLGLIFYELISSKRISFPSHKNYFGLGKFIDALTEFHFQLKLDWEGIEPCFRQLIKRMIAKRHIYRPLARTIQRNLKGILETM